MTSEGEIQFTVPPAAAAAQLPSRVKLQATIGIERAILPLFFAGIFALIGVAFLSGGKHGSDAVLGENGMTIGIGIGVTFWVVSALIWILVDDFYILDRNSRQILLHKGFRFFGKETPFLESGQIIAIGMNSSEIRGKYGPTGWTYTPVVLVRDQDNIELSPMTTNMECTKLGEYNQKTRSWAAALGCHWIECPGRQIFKAQQFFETNRKG